MPLCPLCGAKTKTDYCWAHSWAAGEPAAAVTPPPIAKKPPPAPRQRLELVAGATTGSGRRLVRRTG